MKFLELVKNPMNGQPEAHFDDWEISFYDGRNDEFDPMIGVWLTHKSGWETGRLFAIPNDDWRDDCWIKAHSWAIDFLEIIGVIDEIS